VVVRCVLCGHGHNLLSDWWWGGRLLLENRRSLASSLTPVFALFRSDPTENDHTDRFVGAQVTTTDVDGHYGPCGG